MLIRFNTKIGHIVKHACLIFFKKIYRAVLKIFAKALKFKNYHKIITRMILEKQLVLEITNTSFNRTFYA